MGSVEGDELRYDGGNFGMTFEEVEAHNEERRERRRADWKLLLEGGSRHALDSLAGYMCDDWDAVLVLLAKGEDEKAHEAFDKAFERAIDRLSEDEP